MVLLSVIIPIYKVEKYLRQCIDSVLAQTLTNIEIILVDDGSPDKCPQICDDYAEKDKRITVIHQKNAGLGMARNSGLKIASGKYVAFLDSDDFVLPQMYRMMTDAAERKSADLVICNQCNFQKDKRTLASHCYGSSTISGRENIYNEIIIPIITPYHPKRPLLWGVGNKIYRLSSIKENNSFFTAVKYAEDWAFAIELYRHLQKIVFIEEHLFCYRINVSGSLSQKKGLRPNAFEEHVSIKKMIAQYYPDSENARNYAVGIAEVQKQILVDFVICSGKLKGFIILLRQLFGNEDLIKAYKDFPRHHKKYKMPRYAFRKRQFFWYLCWGIGIYMQVSSKRFIKKTYHFFK